MRSRTPPSRLGRRLAVVGLSTTLSFTLACGGARGTAASTIAAPTGAPVAGPEACRGAGAVDVVDHVAELGVTLVPPSITGSGTVRVRARRPTDVVVLDAVKLEVLRVADGAETLRFSTDGRQLCIELSRSLAEGDERELHLDWEVGTGGPVPRFLPDQAWAGYTTSAWMPTLLDPAQRATLRLRITAASALTAVGPGRSLGASPVADGRATHDFEVDRPTPPFLFAFAVGDFAQVEQSVDGVVLRVLGPRGSDLAGALAASVPMVRFFVERTGAPMPAPVYTEVFVSGDAAQEAAGLALMSADALEDLRKDPTDDWILSHELAHQWFGWLVPCADFADFWLNEGFDVLGGRVQAAALGPGRVRAGARGVAPPVGEGPHRRQGRAAVTLATGPAAPRPTRQPAAGPGGDVLPRRPGPPAAARRARRHGVLERGPSLRPRDPGARRHERGLAPCARGGGPP